MIINTILDTEDFVHLYYPEDEVQAHSAQGCGAGARRASKYPNRPPSPDYAQVCRRAFVHLYYPEDEVQAHSAQGCGAGARRASKYPNRPPSPDYAQVCRRAFVHLYYPEDEVQAHSAQGCGAGARRASKYPNRPPSPDYAQVCRRAFVHLYYLEDEVQAHSAQGCGAGARRASKYPNRPPSPDYAQVCRRAFVHLYYPEDEVQAHSAQGCGAGARRASKYPNRPPSPDYAQVTAAYATMERARAAPPAEAAPAPTPRRVRAADLYPRLRTHYDEPELDAPFQPICGEFVQWVGRTADGGVLALSNYRLHAQARRRRGAGVSVPLRLVDAAEVRDLNQLVVHCKDGRTLKCTFGSGEACGEWWRRASAAAAPAASLAHTFAAAYAAWARELPPASAPRALLAPRPAADCNQWFKKEVERLGFTTRGAWRVTAANAEYKLCPSYPPLLIVPACIGDEDLDSVARFRAMRRVPAVVWRHRGNGAVIARSSQPEVGWLGWRSSEDERLLAAFVSACALDRGLQPSTTSKQAKLLIVDARSYTSAVTNRARGGGCECAQYYPGADIQFMCLPNIHHVRKSFHQLRQLAAEPPDQPNWHGMLERSLWLQNLSGLGRAASLAARAVLAGRPILVHCSDGWDRTPQIVAAAQLLLDPYYRSVEGFRVLVEREWLDYGHKFADRCGHAFGPEEPNERSPIFLQWLDLVHQIMLQYPCSFEFSEAYLIKLVTHAHSCMFGTFLCNSPRERGEARVHENTAHVWKLLEGPAYRNHLYSPPAGEQVLWAEYNVRSLSFWWSLYVGGRDAEAEAEADVESPPASQPASVDPPPPPPTNGVMAKTRSCDNLPSEVDKPHALRRCSDPNIAPDIIKLASLSIASSASGSSLGRSPPGGGGGGGAGPGGGGGGGAVPLLTDSYLEALGDAPPASMSASDNSDQSAASDQVDGLHIHHFENGDSAPVVQPHEVVSRVIASNSSSLERELAGDSARAALSDTALLASAAAREGAQAHGGHVASSPEDATEFLDDNYADLINVQETGAESSRRRHISITWRSVSESSHHTDSSAGFDLAELPSRLHPAAVRAAPAAAAARAADTNGDAGHAAGMEAAAAKLLERELGNLTATTATSSSLSSDSEEEMDRARMTRARVKVKTSCASDHTLCPNSPAVRAYRPHCHCYVRTGLNGVSVEASTDTLVAGECGCGCGERAGGGAAGAGRARCACGGGAGGLPARDPIDGLPSLHSAVQGRLHQIILQQELVVEQLSEQLRLARAALHRQMSSSPPVPRASRTTPPPPPANSTSAPTVAAANNLREAEAEEGVEVGEEAAAGAGVVWVPDSAAPRCQYCRNHFWLARRRHHCRKCGGIFCGSCSEVGGASVRVCRVCRAHR